MLPCQKTKKEVRADARPQRRRALRKETSGAPVARVQDDVELVQVREERNSFHEAAKCRVRKKLQKPVVGAQDARPGTEMQVCPLRRPGTEIALLQTKIVSNADRYKRWLHQ